jgi:hypothetical protein
LPWRRWHFDTGASPIGSPVNEDQPRIDQHRNRNYHQFIDQSLLQTGPRHRRNLFALFIFYRCVLPDVGEGKLAKSASKSKARKGSSKAAKRKKPTRKVSAKAKASPVHEEDHVDSCGCEVEYSDSEATPDEALPAARGGVEGRA